MTLSYYDGQQLKSYGFSDYEIRELSEAKTPGGNPQPPIDIRSQLWKDIIRSRMNWWIDKYTSGWEDYEIDGEVDNYYKRDARRTPWDFLKAEYRPRKRVDYWAAVRAKKQEGIEVAIENYYPDDIERPKEKYQRRLYNI